MRLLKLTAVSFLLFAFIINFISCEPEAEIKKTLEFIKTGIPMTGAQETPATPTSALGFLDVNYNRPTKTLFYKVTWQGLSDTITGMHIHGVAPAGYQAGIVQAILTAKNEAAFPFRGGSYSGNVNIDGVVFKEESLLNGFYYLNIHTKTYGSGEIRAQIKFQ